MLTFFIIVGICAILLIIIVANEIEQNKMDLERESKLSTLHTYYNDIAKMIYLDNVNILMLEEIERLFRRFRKVNK